jgi:hypothetical protein
MKDFSVSNPYTNNQPFPNTKAKTASPGQNDGFVFNADSVDETLGFYQAALSSAGYTPNGTVESSGSSQILNAIFKHTDDEVDRIDDDIAELQQQVDTMYCNLYWNGVIISDDLVPMKFLKQGKIGIVNLRTATIDYTNPSTTTNGILSLRPANLNAFPSWVSNIFPLESSTIGGILLKSEEPQINSRPLFRYRFDKQEFQLGMIFSTFENDLVIYPYLRLLTQGFSALFTLP